MPTTSEAAPKRLGGDLPRPENWIRAVAALLSSPFIPIPPKPRMALTIRSPASGMRAALAIVAMLGAAHEVPARPDASSGVVKALPVAGLAPASSPLLPPDLAATAVWEAELSIVLSEPDIVRVLYEATVRQPSGATSQGDVAVGLAEAGPSQLRGLFKGCAIGIPLTGKAWAELVVAHEAGRAAFVEANHGHAHMAADGPFAPGGIGFLRRQRVLNLGFGPRRSDDGKELIVYDRVVVDIHMGGPASTDPWLGPSADRWGEMLYRQTILNYEQARPWRRAARLRAPAKRTQEPMQGELVKIVVRSQGMYRITGADLEEVGVDIDVIDPGRIRLLYAGGRVLGLPVRVTRGNERREIAAVVEDGGDGRLDAEDYILFYGEAPARWEYTNSRESERYQWLENRYTRDNVYWLAVEGERVGRRAVERSGALQSADPWRPVSYRERLHAEDERFTLLQLLKINSGYDWYWEDFQGNTRSYSTLIEDAIPGDPVNVRVCFYGWSDKSHSFEIKWNDQSLGLVAFSGTQANIFHLTASKGAREGLNKLGLFHRDSNLTRLDWYELEFSRGFIARGGELLFAWPVAAGEDTADKVAEFRLSGFEGDAEPRVFDVSTSAELREIVDFDFDSAAGAVVFQDRFGIGQPPLYLVTTPTRFRRPAAISVEQAAGLRSPDNGAEYVIITHPDFAAAADRLAAWRAQDDRFGEALTTMVVDVEDIYAEFSGGMLDPMAIRSFVNYAVDNWSPAPFFVLLIGDGTYDYKNNSGSSHANWMPAFQDGISTYDEWYVRIEGQDVFPDLAIGRLPVQSAQQAEGLVDKLIDYDRQPEVGPWQTRVLVVSDDLTNPRTPDELESFFLIDAEIMARWFVPVDLDLVKLYIARFPMEGRTKPQARDEFIRRFNEGSLILTYVGHGNPEVLAHEQMFVLSRDQGAVDNGGRLTFMYTAASQVGVFDDPALQSMPEVLLNMPDGGVVGFISATRVGFHDTNMILAREFHQVMYRNGVRHVPMGLALMAAKRNVVVPLNPVGRGNVQRYSLMGDPAQRLALPRYSVDIDMPDSIWALEEIRVRGRVLDPQRRPATDFNGQAWLQVFDSAVSSRLGHLPYKRGGAALYRTLIGVASGRFEATFRVPKDISYRQKEGRVSAYAWEPDAGRIAFGSMRNVVLAGTAEGIRPDDDGPEISIAFKGKEGFASGDFIPANPVLAAGIRDSSGINITGETGHEIELRVDDEIFKVTELFSSRGDYRSGFLEVELPELEPGTHTIRLKAWDTFNNSAFAEVDVHVADLEESVLSQVLFYPNPWREQEEGFFTYVLAAPVESVRIRVFSLAGKLVDDIDGGRLGGFNQVQWDRPGNLANGSYLYRLQVAVEGGEKFDLSAVIQVVK